MVNSRRSIVFSDTKNPERTITVGSYQLDRENPISVGVNHYNCKTELKWDIHTGLEMGIVLRGKVNRWHGNYNMPLKRGQIWLCNAWEPHAFSVVTPPVDVLVIMAWPAGLVLSGIADKIDTLHLFRLPAEKRPFGKSPAMRKRLLELADELICTIDNEHFPKARQILLTRLLLLELTAEIDTDDESAYQDNTSDSLERIVPALNLVHDNPYHRISLDKAAHACHISIALLGRLFRDVMGCTFADFARRYRLARLATELRSNDTKLESLAQKYDFVDAANLVKTFKKHFGLTPIQYRRGHISQ